MLGTRIGHYKVVRLLGEGGMGAVYEALHEQLGRRVAIKVLHPQYARSPDALSRFFNEARAVNVINHPGLVQISEFGQFPDGSAYLVMEYLDGETLSHRLRQVGGRLAEPLVARLSVQLASVLAATHAQGIVHRDLKPGNIMLVPDPAMPGGERLKLLDFGIAKILNEPPSSPGQPRTRTGMLLGTPLYMSPEQCRGAGHVDDKSDVYAFGIILFQMLAGRPPFVADGDGTIIAMQLMDEPPTLHSLAPEVSELLAALIHKMLRKNKSERPSMRELYEQLAQLEYPRQSSDQMRITPVLGPRRDSSPSLSLPLTNPSTIRRSTGQQTAHRRKLPRMTGAAAVVALALVALLIFLHKSPRPEDAEPAAVLLKTAASRPPVLRADNPQVPVPPPDSVEKADNSELGGRSLDARNHSAERSPAGAGTDSLSPPATDSITHGEPPKPAPRGAPKSNPCPFDASCSARAKRAMELYNAKNYEQALREFQTAYTLAQDAPRLLIHIGLCLAHLGRAKQALSYYQSYLQAVPSGDADTRSRVNSYTSEAKAALAGAH